MFEITDMKITINSAWDVADKLGSPRAIRPFVVDGIMGWFDMARYSFMYRTVPEDKDIDGYYVSWYLRGPKQSSISVHVDFEPNKGTFEIKDRTTASGRKRPEYKTEREKALCFILGVCTTVCCGGRT